MRVPPAPADRKARLAVFWIFSLCGVTSSLWSTSLPAISARLHVGETRLGPVRAMAAAGGTAVCGYLLVLLAPSLPAGGLAGDFAGWAVTGLGLATVVPAVFSAVGTLDSGVGRALSRVAMCGYAGELAGPR